MRRSIARGTKNRASINEMKDWVNRLSGTPAFIVGNAPSLETLDLTILNNYFTIGINRAFLKIDTTILMWQDISLWNTEYHKLPHIKSLKVAADGSDPRRLYYNFYIKASDYRFTKQTHILYGRGSSGPLACELAYALGCSCVILIGMDCKRGEDGKSDFWGENTFWHPHTLDNCNKGLLAIREKCPIPVINCSRNAFWPQVTVEAAVALVDPESNLAKGREHYLKKILGKPIVK